MLSWLQNLDVDLFRFINGTLSNPVLDRAMPFVSGNAFFAPALVIIGVLLFKDGARACSASPHWGCVGIAMA
jgi:hypothetical protein